MLGSVPSAVDTTDSGSNSDKKNRNIFLLDQVAITLRKEKVVLWRNYHQKGETSEQEETVVTKNKKKSSKWKEQAVGEIIIEELNIEYVDLVEGNNDENNKPIARDTTTAHFAKFTNELLGTMDLDTMDLDDSLEGSHLVMDNCLIYKWKPMIRKLKAGVMEWCICRYSPELNPIM